MLKVTINSEGRATMQTFAKSTITIGNSHSQADVKLADPALSDEHVRLELQNGDYVIINQAHDPFLTLNELPFGKKRLKPGDHLHIGKTEILFGEMDLVVPPTIAKPSRSFLGVGVAVSLIMLLSSVLLFSMGSQNEEEELQAMRSLADISMGLKRAQLQGATPANLEDPEFLRGQMRLIAPLDDSLVTEWGVDGKLRGISYEMKIYASQNRFLAVVQPTASLMQWFFAKPAFATDSEGMEIRKVDDIRGMERKKGLTGEEDVVPLENLATDSATRGFRPPKELSLIHPGAELLIYNAPRYYRLSMPLVRLALGIKPGETDQVPKLLQELALVGKLRNLVIYTPDGSEGAVRVQKALLPYAPKEGLLVGYLQFDKSQRRILASNLLLASAPSVKIQEELRIPELNQPLYQKMVQLSQKRREALDHIQQRLSALMGQDAKASSATFASDFQQVLQDYKVARQELRKTTQKGLTTLYQEYVKDEQQLTAEGFFSLVQAAGLESFVRKVPAN